MRERAGCFFVAVHPLVDGSDRVVQLEIARRQLEGQLGLVERFLEAAASGQRAGHAVVPSRQLRIRRQRVGVAHFGFLEKAGRPQGVTVQRDGFRGGRRGRDETLGFAAGQGELSDPQRGLDDTRARRLHIVVFRGAECALERVEGVQIAPFLEVLAAEMNLNRHALRRQRSLREDGPRGSR